MKRFNLLTSISAIAALAASPALAQDMMDDGAAELAATPDDGWISLTGEVTSAAGEAFRLDYGAGVITVEMTDFDGFQEAEYLVPGDDVVVYGLVDNDFYDRKTIEASTVYIDDTNSYIYADRANGALTPGYFGAPTPSFDDPALTYTGVVDSVDGREFWLTDIAGVRIEVDTASMAYNPLDNEGYQQIDAGDRVTVTGTIDAGFFENNELSADSVVTLYDSPSGET